MQHIPNYFGISCFSLNLFSPTSVERFLETLLHDVTLAAKEVLYAMPIS